MFFRFLVELLSTLPSYDNDAKIQGSRELQARPVTAIMLEILMHFQWECWNYELSLVQERLPYTLSS